jgi:hypothetical protein
MNLYLYSFKPILMLRCFLSFCLILTFYTASAQNKPTQPDKIKVFLDCTLQGLCDFDFVRTEMKMVDFVRDRLLADVHVLVNTQFISNGAEQNEMDFIGIGVYKTLGDTLTYFNDPNATNDDKRKKLVQYLKLGLTRYIARTGAAVDLTIAYTGKEKTKEETAKEQKRDPWNYWVFSIGASGFLNGDQNYKSSNIYAYINADKETEKIRINFSTSYSKRFRQITTSNNDKVKINNDEQDANYFIARKLNQHWAVGVTSAYEKSVFSNIDSRIRIQPRIEYSFFPYPKFNSDRVVVQYFVGPEFSNYGDSTVYFVDREIQLKQNFRIIASFTKPWGTINLGSFWSNYFDDFKKNNLSFGGSANWRIYKGLQVNFSGNYSFVRDQLSLPKAGASRDDVLTQRRLIASSSDYFFNVGINYRFGSIYSSAIHQTFKGFSY